MKILIEQLRFRALIGILPFERKIPQRVQIDCEINYDYETQKFLDYAELIDAIKQFIRLQKFELLEEAVIHTEAYLYARYPQITDLSLSITKLDILKSASVRVKRR